MWDLPRDVDTPNLPAIHLTRRGGRRIDPADFRETPAPVEDVVIRNWTASDAGQVVASSAATISSHRQQHGSQ